MTDPALAAGRTTPLPAAVSSPVPAGAPTVRQVDSTGDLEDGPTMISTGGHGGGRASEPPATR